MPGGEETIEKQIQNAEEAEPEIEVVNGLAGTGSAVKGAKGEVESGSDAKVAGDNGSESAAEGEAEAASTSKIRIATTEELEKELRRVKQSGGYMRLLRSTLRVLLVVVAVSILIASLFLPVMQIYKGSMEPQLCEGDLVVAVKTRKCSRGDVIGFYYSNKVLVKRVIAVGGDVVELDEEGVFTVNGKVLDEPYVKERCYGEYTDVEFPYTVPEGSYFVVGDNRSDSADSRSSDIGPISEEDIVGKVLFVIWPLRRISGVS